ncbi:MAG: hypothetical protein DRR04_12930 [Gammaproteobacteria bacterium]|nr:MAG: hypothetical protein DRR04_12930 [Gammaproteobacteria bacterium]
MYIEIEDIEESILETYLVMRVGYDEATPVSSHESLADANVMARLLGSHSAAAFNYEVVAVKHFRKPGEV